MKGVSKKTILFLCAEAFRPPYAFLDKVFNKYLRAYGFRTVWIMPSMEVAEVRQAYWGRNPVILLPKILPQSAIEVITSYRKHFQHIHEACRLASARYGPFGIVQVRDDPAMAYVARHLAKKFKIPWAYQISHFKEEEAIMYAQIGIYGSRLKNMLKGVVGLVLRQFLVNRCRLVLPISEQMKQSLLGYRANNGTMVAIEEGVDTDTEPGELDPLAHQVAQEWGLGGGKVIIYVGTMSRFRRLEFLLEAFRHVLSSHPDAQLLMVGDGRVPEDMGWLKDKSHRMGLTGKVLFTGWVTKDKVRTFIRASHVGVSPIPINRVYINSSPIKLLEYLAMEVPAVGTNVPDQKRVIEESGGGICTQWDVIEFAGAVNNLLSLRPEELRAMGRRGRAWVRENRDFSVLADRVFKAYQGL
ncbi:MAG: glycosyltransferase family 4 protein [Deltaproteobacteria bacterium]|nr:glycosyltransferase family 4 protein [Deltaproteobacteria bacterium]